MISCLRACNWNIPNIATPLLQDPVLLAQNNSLSMAVTKISSCWANTTSRREGEGRGGSNSSGFLLVAFFFYFPMNVAGGEYIHGSWRKITSPRPLMTAPLRLVNTNTAWENSSYFMTPLLVYLRNDIWEMSAEIPYWLFLLHGKFVSAYQKHNPDLGSNA